MSELSEIAVRPHAASVVGRFEPGDDAAVTAKLQVLGIAEAEGGRLAAEADPAAVATSAARRVNSALARRVAHADLRTLVPLGLGLLSLRQALRGRDRLGDAPWYLLAWYSSETFFRFHGAPEAAQPAKRQEEE